MIGNVASTLAHLTQVEVSFQFRKAFGQFDCHSRRTAAYQKQKLDPTTPSVTQLELRG